MASYQSGEVRATDLDAWLRGLPAKSRQPPTGEPLDTWLEERIVDVALPLILWRRAEASEWSSSPALALRARYQAAQEIGRIYLRDQCPEEVIPEDDLRALYDATVPQQPRPWILLRHIYKRAAADGEERSTVRGDLTALRAEIEAGASFIEMARRHSDSATAEDGGLIGRVSRQAPMEAKVLDTAWALDDGALSTIVEVSNGFHLLFREASGVEPVLDFPTARRELARQETTRRREMCGQQILKALYEKTPARIEPTILQPASPEDPVLWLGEESFDSEQLTGLSDDGTPLALSPRPRDLVRHLVESLLLASVYAEQGDTSASRLEQLQQQALRQLHIQTQWAEERRRQVALAGEDALKAAFDQQPERFSSDLVIDLGILMVRSPQPGQGREALEEIEVLRRRLLAGESFEELAEQHSEHISAVDGGRLGPLPSPRLQVVLGSAGMAVATALDQGEVSEPVRIQTRPLAAFALLKTYSRQEPQPRSFEDARDDLIEALATDRVRQLEAEVRERVLDEVAWQIHPRSVAAYLAAGGDDDAGVSRPGDAEGENP